MVRYSARGRRSPALGAVKLLFLIAFAAGLAFAGWMLWFALSPVKIGASPLEFSIRQGSALRAATRQIIDAGVALPAWQFIVLARSSGHQGRIKAGSYQVSEGVTPFQILRKITQGEFAQADVVVIEGWTFRQLRAALDAHPELRHDSTAASDDQIMERLGDPGVAAEGMFFPDTYIFAKGDSDFAVLGRAHRVMKRRLEQAWAQRDPRLPFETPYEALILASIVEKETGISTDRGMVAAVFVNRLRLGMRLQTDPSVIYGMGEKFDGNLRKRDLTSDHPFNTYTRAGLPPHPIAMPGAASLEAVMHPAKSDALYFVSRGDGTSEFSRSLSDHNRAVDRYQKRGGARR
jgi:peptidoglycan lytic transglycosylase G